ncbi:hypothetical protein TNCV_3389991 [Trichonephila clavipes]|nr:hypothetical protein TNCV_3389991 [Trichonephila clavipes]
MKQLKEIKEKGQTERDNYWKTIVVDVTTERDVFKNESKEWKAEREAVKSQRDTLKTERDNLLLENCGLRRMLINVTQMFSDLLQK